jgi:hypothetical protein
MMVPPGAAGLDGRFGLDAVEPEPLAFEAVVDELQAVAMARAR